MRSARSSALRCVVLFPMLSCICINTKSPQFSRDVLKEDFRTGLKDLDGESLRRNAEKRLKAHAKYRC